MWSETLGLLAGATIMQAVTLFARRYDAVTIFFHWTNAVLVVVQSLGAQTIDWFPSGPLRVDARSVHITLGATLAVMLVARVVWRLTAGRRLPLADCGVLNVVAKGTHWALSTPSLRPWCWPGCF